MTCYIVTERDANAELLFVLLQEELLLGVTDQGIGRDEIREAGAVRLKHATTRSGAISMARTILATKSEPVALVLDAKFLDPDDVEQERESLIDELRLVAPEVMFKVFLAVPELEECLFYDTSVFEELFETELPDPDLHLKLARTQPRMQLRMLLSDDSLLPELLRDKQEIVSKIRESALISEIRKFLRQHTSAEVLRHDG